MKITETQTKPFHPVDRHVSACTQNHEWSANKTLLFSLNNSLIRDKNKYSSFFSLSFFSFNFFSFSFFSFSFFSFSFFSLSFSSFSFCSLSLFSLSVLGFFSFLAYYQLSQYKSTLPLMIHLINMLVSPEAVKHRWEL